MLTLYVVPPGLGLPSLDPQCLAAITLMKHALSADHWQLVSDVYGVANGGAGDWCNLPALMDGDLQISGYLNIVDYLSTRKPDYAGEKLPVIQQGDWLLANNVENRLSPLLALLFYTSPENYAAIIRPAFGRVLPLPSSWILPTIHRQQQNSKVELAQVDVTASQLSAVAASLADKAKPTSSDTPKTRSDPLSDEDILGMHFQEKLPRESSTSAVIGTHASLRKLVQQALSVYDGEDSYFQSIGTDFNNQADIHTCALFAHIGLAVASTHAGLPHPWLTSTIQTAHPDLLRRSVKWLSSEWGWHPDATTFVGEHTQLPWKDEAPSLHQKSRALGSGLAQLSGVHYLQIPQALLTRSVEGVEHGHTLFYSSAPKAKALGYESDTAWLGVTGAAVAVLAFKTWKEGF